MLLLSGLPDKSYNCTRDAILAAILLKSPSMMETQLRLCAKLQGKEKNRFTGEEPGKNGDGK